MRTTAAPLAEFYDWTARSTERAVIQMTQIAAFHGGVILAQLNSFREKTMRHPDATGPAWQRTGGHLRTVMSQLLASGYDHTTDAVNTRMLSGDQYLHVQTKGSSNARQEC